MKTQKLRYIQHAGYYWLCVGAAHSARCEGVRLLTHDVPVTPPRLSVTVTSVV